MLVGGGWSGARVNGYRKTETATTTNLVVEGVARKPMQTVVGVRVTSSKFYLPILLFGVGHLKFFNWLGLFLDSFKVI